jgi:hypothetical protein
MFWTVRGNNDVIALRSCQQKANFGTNGKPAWRDFAIFMSRTHPIVGTAPRMSGMNNVMTCRATFMV